MKKISSKIKNNILLKFFHPLHFGWCSQCSNRWTVPPSNIEVRVQDKTSCWIHRPVRIEAGSRPHALSLSGAGCVPPPRARALACDVHVCSAAARATAALHWPVAACARATVAPHRPPHAPIAQPQQAPGAAHIRHFTRRCSRGGHEHDASTMSFSCGRGHSTCHVAH